MRTLGVAILGIFLGLITGFILFNEIIGRMLVGSDNLGGPWLFVIGLGPQLFAVVGGVTAVVIDRRIRDRDDG